MFRFKSSDDSDQWFDSFSFGDDSYFEIDTVKTENDHFSFFGFNLFESEETFQDDHPKSRSKLNYYDNSAKNGKQKLEKRSAAAATRNTTEENDTVTQGNNPPKGTFWRPQRMSRLQERFDKHEILKDLKRQDEDQGKSEISDESKNVGIMQKIKGNISRTIGNMKSSDLVESRDDTILSSRRSYHEPVDTTSREGIENNNGILLDKRCFPSWSRMKQRPINPEPLFTINEFESPSKLSTVPSKTNQYDKYVEVNASKQNHYATSSSTSRQPAKHNKREYKLSRPRHMDKKPSNFDYDIWDDDSVSSGWFSLESLDAR
jgi:hypothetical protein